MADMKNSPPPALNVTVLGTGNIARALGALWASRGHVITVGGRSIDAAEALAAELGNGATALPLVESIADAEVVLFAVPWQAVDDVLARLDAPSGAMAGVTIIDPTNPVKHGVGRHLLDTGSVAEHIASRATGARVVKAFNVHPAGHWGHVSPHDLVILAGSDAAALDVVSALVRDVGAKPHALGGLERARQVEELGATVIALAFAGANPQSAVPGV